MSCPVCQFRYSVDYLQPIIFTQSSQTNNALIFLANVTRAVCIEPISFLETKFFPSIFLRSARLFSPHWFSPSVCNSTGLIYPIPLTHCQTANLAFVFQNTLTSNEVTWNLPVPSANFFLLFSLVFYASLTVFFAFVCLRRSKPMLSFGNFIVLPSHPTSNLYPLWSQRVAYCIMVFNVFGLLSTISIVMVSDENMPSFSHTHTHI